MRCSPVFSTVLYMDNNNAAADASMSSHFANAVRPAATCRRCGSTNVCWMKNKAGKSYLANRLITGIPSRGFHNCGDGHEARMTSWSQPSTGAGFIHATIVIGDDGIARPVRHPELDK